MTKEEFLFLIAGYLSGSVLYSYLLPKYLMKIDIMSMSEDGNPGTANVFKYAGAPMGIFVLCLELLKGYVPIHLAMQTLDISNSVFGLILAAPVLGHAYPFLNWKKGGKSIAVSFGVLLGLTPLWIPVLLLAACYLVFSLIIVIRPHFYRSVLTFLIFFAGVMWKVPLHSIVIGSGIISLTVICRHFLRYHGEKFKVLLPREALKIDSWKRD